MIFQKTHHLIPEHKWQTRRPVKPGDMASHNEYGSIVAVYRKGRLLWKVGKDYAKQPGRGQKAVGRTPPVRAIQRERLQEISLEDLWAEGITDDDLCVACARVGNKSTRDLAKRVFTALWDSLYRNPYRWEDNPEVWALEFERSL